MQKFISKTYFKLGMDEPTILLAASEMEEDFHALPPHLSAGPHRLLREMLSHFPSQLRRYCSEKISKIRAEATGTQPPWNVLQLTHMRMSYIAAHIYAAGSEINFISYQTFKLTVH